MPGLLAKAAKKTERPVERTKKEGGLLEGTLDPVVLFLSPFFVFFCPCLLPSLLFAGSNLRSLVGQLLVLLAFLFGLPPLFSGLRPNRARDRRPPRLEREKDRGFQVAIFFVLSFKGTCPLTLSIMV